MTVVTYGPSKQFPAFFTPKSGYQVSHVTLQMGHVTLQVGHVILEVGHVTLQVGHVILEVGHVKDSELEFIIQYKKLKLLIHSVLFLPLSLCSPPPPLLLPFSPPISVPLFSSPSPLPPSDSCRLLSMLKLHCSVQS